MTAVPEPTRPAREPRQTAVRQHQLAGRRMRALLQRLPYAAAAERLTDADIVAVVKRLH